MGKAWSKHRTVSDELRIISLSRDYSQNQIGEMVGFSQSVIHDVQRKYHWIAMRGHGHAAYIRFAYDKELWRAILQRLYVDMRLPLNEVAQRCNLHPQTIRRRLVALGFEVRSSAEANTGKKHKRHQMPWPPCATDGCRTTVSKIGEDHCAVCRKRMARQAAK